uniref:Uncharacterized protein n=1 Tax=viral metagenome TaxID=1070528 RepID=A0A6C0C7N6_9ZZZZ
MSIQIFFKIGESGSRISLKLDEDKLLNEILNEESVKTEITERGLDLDRLNLKYILNEQHKPLELERTIKQNNININDTLLIIYQIPTETHTINEIIEEMGDNIDKTADTIKVFMPHCFIRPNIRGNEQEEYKFRDVLPVIDNLLGEHYSIKQQLPLPLMEYCIMTGKNIHIILIDGAWGTEQEEYSVYGNLQPKSEFNKKDLISGNIVNIEMNYRTNKMKLSTDLRKNIFSIFMFECIFKGFDKGPYSRIGKKTKISIVPYILPPILDEPVGLQNYVLYTSILHIDDISEFIHDIDEGQINKLFNWHNAGKIGSKKIKSKKIKSKKIKSKKKLKKKKKKKKSKRKKKSKKK